LGVLREEVIVVDEWWVIFGVFMGICTHFAFVLLDTGVQFETMSCCWVDEWLVEFVTELGGIGIGVGGTSLFLLLGLEELDGVDIKDLFIAFEGCQFTEFFLGWLEG
jgi:hypothetical protein